LGEAVLVVDQKQSPISTVVAREAVWILTQRRGVAQEVVPMVAVQEVVGMAAVQEAVNNHTATELKSISR
jgi:hypothetical protein